MNALIFQLLCKPVLAENAEQGACSIDSEILLKIVEETLYITLIITEHRRKRAINFRNFTHKHYDWSIEAMGISTLHKGHDAWRDHCSR